MVNRDNSQFAYTANSGNTPTSQIIYETRDPTQYDVYYALRTQWVNSVAKNFWYLNNQNNASGQLLSTWVQISGGGNVLQSLSDTADTPVYPSSASAIPPNNIQLISENSGLTVVSNPVNNQIEFTNTITQGIVTINGDTGSITGQTVTIYADNAANNTGSSVKFVNSGTVSTFNVTDSNDNTFLGKGAGKLTTTGLANCGFGFNSLSSITAAAFNSGFGYFTLQNVLGGSASCAFGYASLKNLTTGQENSAFGHNSLTNLISGTNNTTIGFQSGLNYTSSESSNILINNNGVTGESNVTRIGLQGSSTGQQNKCFIAGIIGNTVSNQQLITVNSSTGQLGVTSSATFNSIAVQTFTSSGTYTPTAGMLYCIVEVVGGGGGGGGAASTNATQLSAAGGGGGGGYAKKSFIAGTIGGSQAVTIGAGGAGGAAGLSGGSGGTTSLGALISATGGAGGALSLASAVSAATAVAVAGGIGSGGDINISGSNSFYGSVTIVTAGSNSFPIAGGGGNSFYGEGGAETSNAPGNLASGYGGGGAGGSCNVSNGTGFAGSAGTPGIVVITEFI